MKKNLALFVIFMALVGTGYVLEELGHKHKMITPKKKLLFSKESIKNINIDKFSLEKKDSNWRVSTYPNLQLSNGVKQLLLFLENISVSKNLEFKSEYFTHQKEILVNGSKLVIGDLLPVTGEFYVSLDDKVYIAEVNITDSNVYSKKAQVNVIRYRELVRLIAQDEFYFLEKRVFRNLFIQGVRKIRIDNQRNRWFELDLEKNKTTPEILKDLEYKKIRPYITNLLSNIKMSRFYNDPSAKLEHKIADITFNELKAEFYTQYNGEKGYFFKFVYEDKVYKIAEGEYFFFSNVQDYWKKKIFKNLNEFLAMKDIPFEVTLKSKGTGKFTLSDFRTFKVSSNNSVQISQNYFNFLFNLILNLSSFKEAKYVISKSNLASNSGIIFSFLGKTLDIYSQGNLLVVYVHEDQLEFYFENVIDIPLGEVQSKLFTLKKLPL